jgi:predicted metal-binding membrane protein
VALFLKAAGFQLGEPAVTRASSLRTALPLEGWAIGLVLLALLFLAWAWLFRMGAASDIYICRVQSADVPAVMTMWAVMMVAMMVPSALPVILAYAQIAARLEPAADRLALVAVFVAVYLVVWSGFGAVAGGADWLLERSGILRDSQLADPRYAGALLVVAGLYQWSAVKSVCLSRCHAPAGFLLQHYRGGYRGALKLGLEHSALCIGCCWILMLLAWVGGAMNLAWMVVLTLFVAIEKLLGTRATILRCSALVLLGAGAVELTLPAL